MLQMLVSKWQLILGAIAAIVLSYFLGRCQGEIHGVEKERSKQALVQAEAGDKAQKNREAIDDETRKLEPSDVDNALRAGGWLRD